MLWLLFPVKFTRICCKLYPLCIRRFTQGRWPAKSVEISKISESVHASSPWTIPRHPGNHHQQWISLSFQLPPPVRGMPQTMVSPSSTKISTNFQFPPPGSSTKPALASSFHHQAAASHQPASSKASSQPAVNSTTLPYPHHGSQVCCCLDILWLYSSIVF